MAMLEFRTNFLSEATSTLSSLRISTSPFLAGKPLRSDRFIFPSKPRGLSVIRMGGGPRTFPGGVSKWQWKRMQEKKAKQLLKARLTRERQLYEMRKRAELKASITELEKPWEAVRERAPILFSVKADDQVKVLADRFQKPGGYDLWTEKDGPQIFGDFDNGLPSARFFPKGAVHSLRPYGGRNVNSNNEEEEEDNIHGDEMEKLEVINKNRDEFSKSKPNRQVRNLNLVERWDEISASPELSRNGGGGGYGKELQQRPWHKNPQRDRRQQRGGGESVGKLEEKSLNETGLYDNRNEFRALPVKGDNDNYQQRRRRERGGNFKLMEKLEERGGESSGLYDNGNEFIALPSKRDNDNYQQRRRRERGGNFKLVEKLEERGGESSGLYDNRNEFRALPAKRDNDNYQQRRRRERGGNSKLVEKLEERGGGGSRMRREEEDDRGGGGGRFRSRGGWSRRGDSGPRTLVRKGT